MPNYVALLRGINVGGNKKVSMGQLRDLLTDDGLGDVRTLLNSGNVVFASKRKPASLQTAIEKVIADGFTMKVTCLVRSESEIRSVIKANPLTEVADNGSRYLALFLSGPLDKTRLKTNDPRELAPDEVRIGDQVIYQWCPDGIQNAPPVGTYVEKTFGVAVTGRNWNTVEKLATMLGRDRAFVTHTGSE
jgi:uncharacterized protein (DUF1697 family)